MKERDVISELAEEINIHRQVAKTARHAIKYGAQHDRLREVLGLSSSETARIEDILREKYAKTLQYAEDIKQAESFQSPIYNRTVRFNTEKPHTNFNRLIQGSCADLLLKCLDYLLDSKEVRLLAHFHDSVYLDCLCSNHTGDKICKKIEKAIQKMEESLDFFWPGTEQRVFKFEIEVEKVWKG